MRNDHIIVTFWAEGPSHYDVAGGRIFRDNMQENKRKKYITRRTWFHWLPAGILSLLLAAVLLYGNIRLIADDNEKDAERTAILVGTLRENLPDLSDTDIIMLLKGGENSEEVQARGAEILQKYGYDAAFFSKPGDDLLLRLVTFNMCVLMTAGACCVILYVVHRRRIRREVRELQAYFRELNRGSYNLDMLNSSSESDLSLLQSDIFKITQLLKTSAEESKEKSEQLSRWLADISHQLKTPIASIRIDLDNMMDDPDMPPELRKEFMKECSIQLEWISSLVQTLLKLARIDAGTVELKKEEMDLLEVAKEAQSKLGILSEISGVDIVWETEPKGEPLDPATLSPVLLQGDPSWQLEAISNIIKNCLEHSTAGSKVYLSLRDTTVFKELTIRDEGEGIPEADLPHIFERFYRAENARQESVGIGLSLASSIVEAGGGKIMVSSERGKGTSFAIRYLT